ncbi:hypothetical protein FRB93_003283 [Tulasnella sp. JGI-2019a]|nr:hypothetical protein FRB93_003283 [Tulasnella sp. JGI-2019a]
MSPTQKALRKRKAGSSFSGSESEDENNFGEALAELNASGQNFLKSFKLNPFVRTPNQDAERTRSLTPEDDDWDGIEDDSTMNVGDELFFSAPSLPGKCGAINANVPSSSTAIVFSEPGKGLSSQSAEASKQAAKALMSSKVSKIFAQPTAREDGPSKDLDVEESLENNDKALHRLLHTQLLAGSMSTELDLSPAERRRALQGRVLELSGNAKLGDGVKVLRHDYKVHQPKGQRDLLTAKEKKIDTTRRIEAAENGLYHSDFKKSLFLQKKTKRRGIDRGIGTGIGRYKDGQLTLSRSDIESVIGLSPQGQGGRGGGGLRGRGHSRS